jgi:hypothetical protein
MFLHIAAFLFLSFYLSIVLVNKNHINAKYLFEYICTN